MKIKSWAIISINKNYLYPIACFNPFKNKWFDKKVSPSMIFYDKKDAEIALNAGKKYLKEKNIKDSIKITPCEIEI